MRVLVCGGRDFKDSTFVYSVLDALAITEVIHGGAEGADGLARLWARHREVPAQHFPANWTAYGRGAGPRRNQQMLDEAHPELVVAFPGGRGTADMVRRAKAVGVAVLEVKP